MEREHAPCSMDAMEETEQNTQQSLSWDASRVSLGWLSRWPAAIMFFSPGWNQVQGRHLQIAAMLDKGPKSRWSKRILLRKKPRMDDLSPGYLSSSSFSIMYRICLAFLDVWSSIFDLSLLRENLGSEIPLRSSSENPQAKNSFLLLGLSLFHSQV